MNRPRNRQPRPPRNDRRPPRTATQSANTNIPTTHQVVPGASVSIVLKADQPTGREVQGTVQDLLTRGDHPRGIKVRLQDGRIGRVQRLVAGGSVAPATAPTQQNFAFKSTRNRRDYRLEDEHAQEPPPRNLADFLPQSDSDDAQTSPAEGVSFSSATVKCPICGVFEGDEAAVSHHVDEHLT